MLEDKIDELNVACRDYARTLTDVWVFTGWKPSQGNLRLHAQWLRCDEYDGQRYYSQAQCFPLESAHHIDLEEAKARMREALDGSKLFTELATISALNIPWADRKARP
jgi:hypothetical protein